MEKVEGRVFHDSALPGLTPRERRSLYFSMAETLAKLHRIDPGVIGLADFGRPGRYFERQLARWSQQWAASPTKDIAALDELVAWLPAHLPPDDGRIAIAHGDFRFGNLMIHPTEPRVVAILDWELSTLGPPLADLGFCCMPWHTAPHDYRGLVGLDSAALGIPSEADVLRHYASFAEPGGVLQRFHIAFALFRFSVIFVGIADRARAGTAAGADAAELGHLARNFAERALEVAHGRPHR
jgi:aminoglycoside phosphotransferase (APT) family kinase protein